MERKIVLVGAGSSVFTQGIVADIILNSTNINWEIALVDINEEALDIVSRLCRKMIEAKSSNVKLVYSTDRRDVLPGAHYVVTTIGVGGRRAWEQDVFIPRKYGIFQPVGDSVMVGGISRAQRMIPAVLDIANDIKELCPQARFLNYSNPMTSICRAVNKASPVKVTGLCHGVIHTEERLRKFLGVDRSNFSSYAVGLNHLTFFLDICNNGWTQWPEFVSKFKKLKEKGYTAADIGKNFDELTGNDEDFYDSLFSYELYKKLGVFPANGDRHVSEFFAEEFPNGEYYGKKLGIDAFSLEYVTNWGDRAYLDMKEKAYSDTPLQDEFFERFEGEHEQLLEIIHSMEFDERKIFSSNIVNNGIIGNLPDYAVVEVPAVAGCRGFLPIRIGNLPAEIAAILQRHISICELTVDAALSGDRKLFLEAVLSGGYLNSRDIASAMVDELLYEQKKYLPQYQ